MIDPTTTMDQPTPDDRTSSAPAVAPESNAHGTGAVAQAAAAARGASRVARKGPELTVENLDAFYGGLHAIKRVSLTYAANQVTAMIGPSGSGTSTDLRCLNRMHEEIPGARAEGRILLEGEDVLGARADVVAVRRAIGMVFQKPNPFPTMSIFDNVAAGIKLTGARG